MRSAKLKRTWKLDPFLKSLQKIPENYCPYLYLSVCHVEVQKIYSKKYSALCTNTHHDITDLVNHGFVKNTKTRISWEQIITFLKNKKKFLICASDHILKSYRLVAEVSFNVELETSFLNLNYRLRREWYWWVPADERLLNILNCTLISEMYSDPSQTSRIELFANKLNDGSWNLIPRKLQI